MSEKDPVDLVAESVKLQETALKLQIKNQPALRDLFAMAALQGLLAKNTSHGEYGTYAIMAYRHADHMLAERNRHQNTVGGDPE
jgi:hypothetical protein